MQTRFRGAIALALALAVPAAARAQADSEVRDLPFRYVTSGGVGSPGIGARVIETADRYRSITGNEPPASIRFGSKKGKQVVLWIDGRGPVSGGRIEVLTARLTESTGAKPAPLRVTIAYLVEGEPLPPTTPPPTTTPFTTIAIERPADGFVDFVFEPVLDVMAGLFDVRVKGGDVLVTTVPPPAPGAIFEVTTYRVASEPFTSLLRGLDGKRVRLGGLVLAQASSHGPGVLDVDQITGRNESGRALGITDLSGRHLGAIPPAASFEIVGAAGSRLAVHWHDVATNRSRHISGFVASADVAIVAPPSPGLLNLVPR